MRTAAMTLYYVMILLVVAQFCVLFFKDVGFLPLWILLEYMQLVAFMPIYNFKLIPYLYDAFKPFLIAHLVLFDNYLAYEDMESDYFNVNYDYYKLSVGKLLQSFFNICILFLLVLAAHATLYALKCTASGSER